MELQEAVKGYEEQLLKSLQESIRIRSVQGEASEQYPYGKGVQDCLDHALKTAEALGFATIDLDHQMGLVRVWRRRRDGSRSGTSGCGAGRGRMEF